jgi:thiamine-phosphate pyrophosphorylase
MTLVLDPAALTLLAITDDLRDGPDGLVARAIAAVRGGATMVQLRLKDAEPRTTLEVARRLLARLTVPLVINDRMDVALAAGAAGVHLGMDDLPVTAARHIAPTGFIIGASVGNDAEVSNARGADYVGIGPLYTTNTKGDAGSAIGVAEFARLARACMLPAVAIGGISAQRAGDVMAAGAAGVAAISAIFRAADVESATRSLRAAIGR